jgi:threonine aldolase
MEFINLKSDTVTEPTKEMRAALLTQKYGNMN